FRLHDLEDSLRHDSVIPANQRLPTYCWRITLTQRISTVKVPRDLVRAEFFHPDPFLRCAYVQAVNHASSLAEKLARDISTRRKSHAQYCATVLRVPCCLVFTASCRNCFNAIPSCYYIPARGHT